MEKLRIGLIGCGGNMIGHLRRLVDITDAEVVALSDPSQESLDRMRDQSDATTNLPNYSNHTEMIDKEGLNAAVISSPHTLHYEHIVDSLDAGLHVLTEKPMVCSVEHAKSVIQKSEQTDRILMVSYQRHLAPTFRFMRNQISSGEMGEVQFVNALQDQNWYRSQKGKWRQVKSLSGGGQLNDSGSHLLDIILWMVDKDPVEVSARMEYFDAEVDINTSMTVLFDGGALASFSIVGNAPGPGIWEDITIWGERGALYARNGKLTCQYGQDPIEVKDLPTRFTNPDQNFVDAVFGRDEVQVPPSCGLRVIQLTEAAWESAESGGNPVKVKT